MPKTFNYSQLVDRFGEITAWHCLVEIEKAANIRPQQALIEPEARLAKAIRAQDAVCSTFMQAA